MSSKDFSQEEVIIDVDHLTKDYGYGRGVFDVSIKVHRGECYGYLGPNGAGKSTTIRHIMGFSSPQKGSIRILGVESFGHTDAFMKDVGYLPGEPSLPAGLNGWEFLRMMQDMRGERNDEKMQEMLELFRLDPSPAIKSMSLGEKRKLAVVAAFMNDPQVLILDEPTSGLDPIMQKVFISFLLSEKKRGKTILLSSHIFSEVDATCDTISIIKDGIHVSTFRANDLKNQDQVMYVLHFFTTKDCEDFLAAEHPFKILESNPLMRKATIQLDRKEFKKVFEFLRGYRVSEFEEKPFTLQDYFLSFYKEDRVFAGLSGVEGNTKEGGDKK